MKYALAVVVLAGCTPAAPVLGQAVHESQTLDGITFEAHSEAISGNPTVIRLTVGASNHTEEQQGTLLWEQCLLEPWIWRIGESGPEVLSPVPPPADSAISICPTAAYEVILESGEVVSLPPQLLTVSEILGKAFTPGTYYFSVASPTWQARGAKRDRFDFHLAAGSAYVPD